jgi:hypothetical protein
MKFHACLLWLCVNLDCVSWLIKQDCELTQPMYHCDLVFSNTASYLTKPLSWWLLLFQMIWLSPKTKTQDFFWYKSFPNLLFIKFMGMIPLFWKLLFYKYLISGFQSPLRKLDKGDLYVSICFWKYLQKLDSLIWNSFQLHHGMIIIEHLLNPWSRDAWSVPNVWLCVMSWPCVISFEYKLSCLCADRIRR